MKKTFSKMKAVLTAFWVTLISFSSKTTGMQELYGPLPPLFEIEYQAEYGVEHSPKIYEPEQLPTPTESTIIMTIKVASLLLVFVTFAFGIISFIKIMKIDDKTVKKKKIKNAVIIVSILIILIIALVIFAPLLKEYFS